jgi:6-phosphogluconolactonase (cycloisomerase 2 family)
MRSGYFSASISLCLMIPSIFMMTGCGSGGGGTSSDSSSSGSSGGSSQETEYLYARAPFDVLAYKIDSGSGKPSLIQTIQPSGNTSMELPGPLIAANSSATFLYAVNDDADGISAYAISSDGTLTEVSGSPFTIPYPTVDDVFGGALLINPTNTALYSIYSDEVAGFQMNPTTGVLTAMSSSFDPGNGFVAGPNGFAIDPEGTFLYTSDSFTNVFNSNMDMMAGISGFSIDSSSGGLSLLSSSPILLPANSQPGQVVFSPDGNFLYVTLYNTSAIAGFSRNSSTGTLTSIPGSPFASTSTPPNQTEWLVMHPTGKFLYVFNLNGNSISVFAIDPGTGVLTPISGSPFAGQSSQLYGPMAIDPSGKYLYVIGGNALAIYTVNQTTGALSVVSGSPVETSFPLDSITIVQVPQP